MSTSCVKRLPYDEAFLMKATVSSLEMLIKTNREGKQYFAIRFTLSTDSELVYIDQFIEYVDVKAWEPDGLGGLVDFKLKKLIDLAVLIPSFAKSGLVDSKGVFKYNQLRDIEVMKKMKPADKKIYMETNKTAVFRDMRDLKVFICKNLSKLGPVWVCNLPSSTTVICHDDGTTEDEYGGLSLSFSDKAPTKAMKDSARAYNKAKKLDAIEMDGLGMVNLNDDDEEEKPKAKRTRSKKAEPSK